MKNSNAASVNTLLKRGFSALQARQFDAAENAAKQILAINPEVAQAHLLVGLIGIETGNRKVAANAFNTVVKLDPKNAGAWTHLAKIFSELGYVLRADAALQKAESLNPAHPILHNILGSVWTLLGEHEKAHSWFLKAHTADRKVASYGVNLANAQSFLGHIDDAEKTLAHVLDENPGHAQAHWILSGLKKASDTDHADRMLRLATQQKNNPQAVAFLAYGAGKEFEDLELWDQAFDAFVAGAAARRSRLQYDEAEEDRLFRSLIKECTADWFTASKSEVENSAPIFIVGQPRTGTTLIERVVTSHSEIASAGELQQFYLSMRRLSRVSTPGRHTAALVKEAVQLDSTHLGTAYGEATRKHADRSRYFVDKMPINFLYVPLIARALPNAKFIHLTRGAMDSCFASFKQLFADTYLHSYDLEEMARHFVRYHELMKVWRDLLGDRMLEVSYEATVSDLEPNARRIVQYLGVEWQDACLNFHKQKGAVSTASAVQVREPVHSRSVARWRKYEAQLQPVAKILSAAGIEL